MKIGDTIVIGDTTKYVVYWTSSTVKEAHFDQRERALELYEEKASEGKKVEVYTVRTVATLERIK